MGVLWHLREPSRPGEEHQNASASGGHCHRPPGIRASDLWSGWGRPIGPGRRSKRDSSPLEGYCQELRECLESGHGRTPKREPQDHGPSPKTSGGLERNCRRTSTFRPRHGTTLGSDLEKGLSNTNLLSKVWETKGRILLKEGHNEEAIRFLKSAWSVTLDGSCGDMLAQAFERLGRVKEATRHYELAAVATGADREGIGKRYKKLTGHVLADGRGHYYKNGKMLPSPSDHLLELRTAHFPNTKPLGTVNAVVVVSPERTEDVLFYERADELKPQTSNAKALQLRLEFPDSTPRRIFLRGGMEFGTRGGTFIFVVP